MEISSSSSGIVFRRRPIPCFSGGGGSVDNQFHSSSLPTPTRRRVFNGKLTLSLRPSPSPSTIINTGGHLNYSHAPAVRCGKHDDKNKKKKLKLLKKALSKDLSMFSDFGFFGQLQGNIVSEAADALLRQLQQVRAEEKELKRKKKLDKKATRRMTTSEGNRLTEKEKEAFVVVHELLEAGTPKESTSTLPSSPNTTTYYKEESSFEDHSSTTGNLNTCSRSINNVLVCDDGGNNGLVSSKRIEVCMGGKCKKSGGAELLEEFGRAIGSSNVVGCKCMGKCKDGPNVRVFNYCFDHGVEPQGLDDSVRTPTNPLCIGVGLADVAVILANFFGEDACDFRSSCLGC